MDHQPSSSNPHFFHEVLASVQYTGHVVPNPTVVNKHQILTLLIDPQSSLALKCISIVTKPILALQLILIF